MTHLDKDQKHAVVIFKAFNYLSHYVIITELLGRRSRPKCYTIYPIPHLALNAIPYTLYLWLNAIPYTLSRIKCYTLYARL